MINFDFTIISLAILLSLYFALFNLITRFRYLENLIFALANFSFAAMLFINLYQIINHDSVNLTNFTKYYFSLLIFTGQCILFIIYLFPGWEKRPGMFFTLLLQILGFLLIGITLFTDYIIVNTVFESNIINTYGRFVYLYPCVLGVFIIGINIIVFYKTIHSKNELFKSLASAYQIGLITGTIALIVFFIILPFYFNIHTYKSLGFFCSFFLQLLLNYSISDKRQMNFKNFYLKIFIWLIYTIILFIPTYWFIKEIVISDLLYNNVLLFSVSITFPFLFFVMYRFFRPVIIKILNIKIKALINKFDNVSRNISELSDMRKQKMDWDNFYQKGIDTVCEILQVETALFFQLNKELKVYELMHTYKTNVEVNEIPVNSDNINAFKENNIIEKSLIYTDKKLKKNKDTLLKFFHENNVESVLSILSYKKELLGFLLLGRLSDKKNYTADFLSFLDNYRIQFGILLENLIFAEEIRKTQVIKRDKMVVKNIKRKIIPVKFKNLEGLTISSLFVSNSDFGGDFFDSVNIRSDKLGIYIANTSDAGVESSMLALQMSSVFHAQADIHESPEGLLNVMNKVLCTSRFTEKYATALYLVYNESSREIEFSNAAFNPLIVFDPVKENFTEIDAEGIPIGIDLGFNYKHRTLVAFPDGIGFCYSPGVASAIDKRGNNYSISRIKDIIRVNKNDGPAELVRKIYDDIKNFTEGIKLLNDISLIIFKTV